MSSNSSSSSITSGASIKPGNFRCPMSVPLLDKAAFLLPAGRPQLVATTHAKRRAHFRSISRSFSIMDHSKVEEERLREAACFGDTEALQMLIKRGVNVNAKHDLNGWTALHWASKRNQTKIVKILLENGAEKGLLTNNGELAVQLTTDQKIVETLIPNQEAEVSVVNTAMQVPLPIVPNYLRDPPMAYRVDTSLPNSQPRNERISLPVNYGSPVSSVQPAHSAPLQGIPSVVSKEEVVLKIRVAETGDPDFIEVDLPRTELTYSGLVRLCCEELKVDNRYIERLRKLPNTILRRDKDIQRLDDYTEVEVVLLTSKVLQGGLSASANEFAAPGSRLSVASSATSNGYQSISMYKNQTILY